MKWHADPEVLDRYATRPESIDDTTASSIEQHLLTCDACRAAIAGAAPSEAVEASWLSVADVIDRPRPALLERLLVRFGVSDDTARLVGATGSLQLAWVGAVVVVALAAVLVADAQGSNAVFLVLAPILPAAAAAVVFLPVADPGGEAGVPTAMHGAGVALRRIVATVLPTIVVLALVAPLLPSGTEASAAWLLPALALASASLLLGTVIRLAVALAMTAFAWVAILTLAQLADGRATPTADTASFGAVGQVVAAVVFAAALFGLALRRDRFATMEVTW